MEPTNDTDFYWIWRTVDFSFHADGLLRPTIMWRGPVCRDQLESAPLFASQHLRKVADRIKFTHAPFSHSDSFIIHARLRPNSYVENTPATHPFCPGTGFVWPFPSFSLCCQRLFDSIQPLCCSAVVSFSLLLHPSGFPA